MGGETPPPSVCMFLVLSICQGGSLRVYILSRYSINAVVRRTHSRRELRSCEQGGGECSAVQELSVLSAPACGRGDSVLCEPCPQPDKQPATQSPSPAITVRGGGDGTRGRLGLRQTVPDHGGDRCGQRGSNGDRSQPQAGRRLFSIVSLCLQSVLSVQSQQSVPRSALHDVETGGQTWRR